MTNWLTTKTLSWDYAREPS